MQAENSSFKLIVKLSRIMVLESAVDLKRLEQTNKHLRALVEL